MSALKGLRVVELGQLLAGPFCGQLLGDMGAEVIKVEPPGAGDPMRVWGQGEEKVQWEVIARNKKSVSANLRIPEGQALVRQLIGKADILIENFKPGTMEKWGFSPEALLAEHPGLIIARMSGYGQTGPYSDRAGFGGIGEAMGGWRYIVGEPDRSPSRMGISIGDTLTATYGCMGVLAALHHRSVTGHGQVIDAALYESVLQVMEGLVPEYDHSGFIRERSGSILPGIAPSNVYICKDGEYMIGANKDSLWQRLAEAMGMPDLGTDPRFATHLARGHNQFELDDIINAWAATLTVDEVDALMIAYSIPAGRVYRAPEMLEDPHFQAREAIIEVETERYGKLKMQGAFPKMSATPSSVRSPAPSIVGQHNAEIYGGLLGMDIAELDRLKAAGAI
ncbi:MAG: formyl-CoA transferase [Sphingomonadales bacterium 35-56-22]|uniref:CaiB/BaiF CoA transferase family protein n=1 Tax=Sphingorhabdus sp. TaxID=1902408 RepID=UPI000BCBB3AD|nr:CoA transferase [Sphingorhabdus sp.]OYY15016.1 MAG: formyl-CoA transferase [Sphingomonadales bacterium 35-56-22]OYY96609.1 MAG: formyl-CoA transferase [Sphingomonadales bacterium 28-56-43]OYZ59986.1 MAG: formyl-CoA transferase [Sphingomonadales bacterium 24-56-14]OZA82163.1 MAG: formyl-CoA transferase [Sphingomonadales bacterium 39-57-19]HQS13370.1 CoA transferase [Sphingorhabdus sp.]